MIYSTIVYIFYCFLRAYQIILGLSIIISWLPQIRSSRFGINITLASNWYLDYFRNKVILGPIDLGPLIGIILYDFLISFIWI